MLRSRSSQKPLPANRVNSTVDEEMAFIAYFKDEIGKVEEFYLTQYEHTQKRATYFSQDGTRYPLDPMRLGDMNVNHGSRLEEYLGGLLELLEILQKVRWFGYVNRVASQRILEKFERLAAVSCSVTGLDSLLNPHAFVQQNQCLGDIRKVETAIDTLKGLQVNGWTESARISQSDLLRNLPLYSKEPLHALASILARREKARNVLYKNFEPCESSAYPTLDESLIDSLKAADGLGRLPIHYAAESGLLHLCRFFLQPEGGDFFEQHAAGVVLTQDFEGNTPLHLSIIGGHAEVTEYLVKAIPDGAENGHPELNEWPDTLGSMLHLAARSNSNGIFQILCSSGAKLDHIGCDGETVLHIAARNGNAEMLTCIRHLAALQGLGDRQEMTSGCTALMIACAGGFEPVVKVLISAGADPYIVDARGWTAKEHAAFRGHLGLFKYLNTAWPPEETIRSASDSDEVEGEKDKELSLLSKGGDQLDTTQAQIQISLGASNTRSNTDLLELHLPRWSGNDVLREQVGFALEVGMLGAFELKQTIHLPLLEDVTNNPICLGVSDPHEACIMFRLVRLQNYGGGDAELIGSGVAIVKSLRERLASKHESLVRDHTIPILSKDMLDVVGRVTFSFLIISPFSHLRVPPVATLGFWNKHGRTEVVGHRGSGANTTSRSNLQIGENTIQSFVSAVAAGASCVEFDVQLTKDLIPVIFHDFLVMETGGDVPLHTLTLDQFMHLSKLQSVKETRSTDDNGEGWRPRPRSMSESRHGDGHDERIRQRMRYTEEGIRNEVKGNLRGVSIQEPSTTLEELLTELPESMAFNLEMKYPMLWEAEDRSMDFFAVELNLFVDTILGMIYCLGGRRSITFSSFSPEICILLSIKQQDYPVLFISKAGSVPTGDVRAGSLQQAMHFAKSWRLAGIVMLSDVFVPCPRLLRYAKSAGLVCGSYGNLNDDPACAKIQAEAGLDAIMVNKVRLITQELAGSSG
ncbi:MAG: hypothetical protein LQ344_002902 [Seirophora lacunosa]|nr:MAG: hypothetical protein LQ344_002902 [Seirophora lacunosa]